MYFYYPPSAEPAERLSRSVSGEDTPLHFHHVLAYKVNAHERLKRELSEFRRTATSPFQGHPRLRLFLLMHPASLHYPLSPRVHLVSKSPESKTWTFRPHPRISTAPTDQHS